MDDLKKQQKPNQVRNRATISYAGSGIAEVSSADLLQTTDVQQQFAAMKRLKSKGIGAFKKK